MGGSNASAADVKQSLESAISAGEEPLHRSKTCWLQLKYAVDDEGTLKLFTHTPGKSPILHCIRLATCHLMYISARCAKAYWKAKQPVCFLLDVTCGRSAMQTSLALAPFALHTLISLQHHSGAQKFLGQHLLLGRRLSVKPIQRRWC